jgi:hypothetical protein
MGLPGESDGSASGGPAASGAAAGAPVEDGAGVQARAAGGVADHGGPLPFLDQIQASFGRHEVGHVESHVGGAAADAAADIGAEAYATGNHVAFAKQPDLHTAAHEAAHVVQQRGGVQLKDGVGRAGDAYERHADQVADRVVAGSSAEDLLDPFAGSSPSHAVQRRPGGNHLGGALVTEAELRERGEDSFPGPVTVSLLGDPFEVRLYKADGKLAVKVTYLGPYAVDATQPVGFESTSSRSIVLMPDRRRLVGVDPSDENRPYSAQMVSRGADGVTFDLYGDGGHILEVRDRVDNGFQQFDRRVHELAGRLNGFPTYPAFLAVHLPLGDGKGGDERERVVARELELNGDKFSLRARRHGDSAQVVLSLARQDGESQVLVPIKGGPAKNLCLELLRNDGRNIDVDLTGDGQADARLIHTVNAPPRPRPGRMRPGLDPLHSPFHNPFDPTGSPPHYIHNLAAYDGDGVRLGTIVHKMNGVAGDIPPEQDDRVTPAPQGAAMPSDRDPIQGDIPGETPRAIQHTGRDWELRMDGDGDRTKELLLRFAPRAGSHDKPHVYSLAVTQLSSGATVEQSFALTEEQARGMDMGGPQVIEATDGEKPARIQLGNAAAVPPLLSFYEDQFYAPDRTTYRAHVDRSQQMVFPLPSETRSKAWLTDQEAAPPRTRSVAKIQTIDVELSEYKDRFRVTAEKVDSGEVVLGVSALAPEGPVAGFSTRLKDIYQPRLDSHADLPTMIVFYARPDWGFANLNLTSALDPPKDQQGRVIDGPPSAHRDHRIAVHGEVVRGQPEHTFRVRDGRFVAGWEKSKDNRHAAGAAQAVGILDEQRKHPQVGEFRVQIDAALDAEIQKAVKLGWIDGMAAEAWNSLRQDMVFIQAQAASGNVAPDRVSRAGEAAEMVADWLSRATADQKVWVLRGTRRRLAPGEAVGPGGQEPITGTGSNEHTGEIWNVKDGIRTDVRVASWGTQTSGHLGKGDYASALQTYGKLRDGVGKWIGKKFEQDPKYGKDSPEATRMAHLIKLGNELEEVEGAQARMQALDSKLDAEVATAAERGVIARATADTWNQLKEDMVLIGGQTASGKADQTLVDRARSGTGSLDEWLAGETADRTVTSSVARVNLYTGVQEMRAGDQWLSQAQSNGRILQAQLEAGEYTLAVDSYRRLRNGVVKWIAEKTRDKFGATSSEFKTIEGLQKDRESRRDVVRVPATFIADESYEKMPDKGSYKQKDFGKYRQVPLQLFVWSDGKKWHLRDLHNPKQVWEAEVDYDGEAQPPEALFKQLDHKKHLPKGDIHYDLPGGQGGRVRCKAEKEWYEWVADIALILAAVGLVLVTLGAATPLVVGAYATAAFAASAVLGAVASGGELADGLDHGFADDKMIVLNVLDIVASLASVAAMGGGKLAMGAAKASTAAKAGTGAAWKGGLAWAAKAGSLVYRPMTGLSILADGASLLIMTTELQQQMDEIDRTVKDPNDRQQAKARLLAQFAVSGGMVMLSIKGDLPDLRTGSPNIVLDKMNGITVARVGDVKLGKQHVELPDGDANLHASARWQSQDLEAQAAHGRSPEARKQAADLIEDKEFQGWYAKWMAQPDKVKPGRGKPVVKAPDGAPDKVVKRLQDMVDSGDMLLHEKAFARADEVAELRKAAGDLDIDPRHADSWPATRAKLVEKLGGDERAERLVARYEAARLGGGGDLGNFVNERAQLNRTLPDSEIERIRNLFPEHEVYVASDAARPGQPRQPGEVEVAVVVKNGTEPGVMHAIEQRAQGHVVHPEPSSRKPGQPEQNLRLRAKVMTEDQFFGMATASTKGRGAPRYHSLSDDLGSTLGLGSVEVRPQGNGRYVVDPAQLKEAQAGWKGRGDESVSRLKYDPDTNSMYFEIHGAGKGAKIRVEAPLPARITSAGDWKSENRIVGTRTLPSAEAGHDILRAITRGDFSVIPRELGVPLPRGFNTADGLEFGLGQLPDGRFVIIRGEIAAVNWSGLPGVKAVGHTHPPVKGNDLDEDVPGGSRRISLDELKKVTDVPLLQRAKVYPSPGDVHYMSFHGIGDHRVITGFVVKDGFVMKPGPDWKGDARLEFRIVKSEEVGHIAGDNLPVHRATIIGMFEGKEVLRSEVHVTPPTKVDKDGVMYMKPPDGFVPATAAKTAAPRGGAPGTTPRRTGMPTREESEAQLLALRDKLSPGAKAELDEISKGKQPEEVWGDLHGKGDPAKYLEGKARKKADGPKKAADKEARIAETHQRLRDTGFFDSPLIKQEIARGDTKSVRGHIAEHLAKINAEAEFKGKADHLVLDDVDVSRQFGTFKTVADAEASLPPGEKKPLYFLDGKVWERLTNFDVLVLNKREVVRMQEVKSGKSDQHSKAKQQQEEKAVPAMAAIAAGDKTVRLHHHRKTDITDTIDAATADSSKAKTTGPDDKGFEMKLGVTTSDLNRLANDIVEQATKGGT